LLEACVSLEFVEFRECLVSYTDIYIARIVISQRESSHPPEQSTVPPYFATSLRDYCDCTFVLFFFRVLIRPYQFSSHPGTHNIKVWPVDKINRAQAIDDNGTLLIIQLVQRYVKKFL